MQDSSSPRPLVLVLEDAADVRRDIVRILQTNGFAILEAQSKEEALRLLQSEKPDLVLIDAPAPKDRQAIVQAVRTASPDDAIPIVALVAPDQEDEIARALGEGIDDVVRKPVMGAALVARARVHLRYRRTMEELAKNERDARILIELTQSLASTLSFREILNQVVRRLAEVIRVDRCSLILVRAGEAVGHVVASSDIEGDRTLPLEIRKYPEISVVVRSGSPVLIPDTASHPLLDGVRDEGGKVPFASLLLFPIRNKDETIGILSLRTSARRDELTDHEIGVCQLIASAMAIALPGAKAVAALRIESEQIATAAQEAQSRLEALERYADFFNSAADGILVIDEHGKVLFANPRASLVLGQPITTVVGRTLEEFVEPAQRESLARLVARWSGGEFPTVDLPVITAEQLPRVLAVSANALVSGDRSTLLTVRDVTAERTLQSELRATKEFLEKLISSSVDAIVAADMRGIIILFNPGAERIYGYPAEEVVGRLSVEALYPPGLGREVMRRLRSSQFGGVGKLEQMRAEITDRSGTRVPITLSAALIYENDLPVASFGIFTDLRERLGIEERLAQAQRKLELSEKQAIVAELAGTAAHELNQPLTSVMGYAEMLKRKLDRDSPHYRAADIIVREAERMAEVVRKIGKITRYETKSYVGQAQILDLGRAAEEDRTAPVAEPTKQVEEKPQ